MLKQYKLRNYHFQLVISILVLNIIGILIIGSAKHSVQKMQILGCIIGMVAMVIVSLMDYSFILRFTWLYYIGIIVLLGLVMTGIPVLSMHTKATRAFMTAARAFANPRVIPVDLNKEDPCIRQGKIYLGGKECEYEG